MKRLLHFFIYFSYIYIGDGMDRQVLYAFLLTTIAGLSTMIGCFFIFIPKKTKKIIIGSLSFASAVMFTVSFTDLIPESFSMLTKEFRLFPCILIILICMNVGIIFSLLIDKYLPDGVEQDGLYRVGIISMFAIILHNIPEGMATFMAGNTNIHLGIALTFAIALHNIPEGISISIPIYYAAGSKKKALWYTFISGLSELFGAIITYLFLKPFITNRIMGYLFALIAGIMLHISLFELLPTSWKYKSRGVTILYFIIGFLFILINHFIFK